SAPAESGSGRGSGRARGGARRGAGVTARHTARWIALAVGLVVAVLGVVLALNVGSDPQADAQHSRLVGRPAPEFEVRTLDGTPVTLTAVAGKSVVVNFWNTWCIPCQEELPALKAFYAKHQADPDFVM